MGIRLMGSNILVVALGAVQRGDEILVFEEESPDTGETYYRLLGGGVEFGEHSQDAVTREFEEELGVEFVDPMLVDTFEHVFTFDGETNHEVWRVYEGHIVEDWPYERESFTYIEPEFGTEHLARWMSVKRLRDPKTTFYVPEVLDGLEL